MKRAASTLIWSSHSLIGARHRDLKKIDIHHCLRLQLKRNHQNPEFVIGAALLMHQLPPLYNHYCKRYRTAYSVLAV